MAYPPSDPANNQTNTTPTVDNHAPHHVALANAIIDIVDELGAGPKGGSADLTARLSALDTAVSGKQASDVDLTAIAALTTTAFGRSFLELANAGAGRTLLGLGTAATSATGDFDAAGSAAAAQAASQPVDADLTAIAALSTTAYGRSLLEAANAAALRTLAGLGTAATSNTGDFEAAGAVSTHTGDTSDAHDASAVSFAPAGSLAATDVQAALVELDSEKSGTGHNHDAAYLDQTEGDARYWQLSTDLATQAELDTVVDARVAVAGDTMTGQLVAQAGVKVTDDDGNAIANGYRALLGLVPPAADEEVVGVVVKIPDTSYGVGQDYAEGNALVVLSDADGTVASPTVNLETISATTDATPVAVTTSTTHGWSTGDIVRITGTGIAALDDKRWKITVTSTTAFTLDGSTAPGSTAAAGYAFSDRSAVLTRLDSQGGLGLVNGVHLATGLRGRAGQAIPAWSMWVDPCCDATGITIHNPSAEEWAPTPVSDFFSVVDVRSDPDRNLFRIEADGTITLRPQSGKAASGTLFRTRNDGDSADSFIVRNDGGVYAKGNSSVGNIAPVATAALAVQPIAEDDVGVAVFAKSGTQTQDLLIAATHLGAYVSRFNKDGVFFTRRTSAPADGDLANSEVGFWFDDTNGASKLMLKAKQADGTVKSAFVPMGFGSVFARKTADESVTSSTVLQNDDHLLLALEASHVYTFEAVLFVDGDAAGDIKTAFTVPAGATLLWGVDSPAVGAASHPAVVNRSVQGASGGTATGGTFGAGTKVMHRASGVVVVDVTAGNLQLQWAQQASSGTATTVFTNSYLRALRVT